MCRCDGYTAGLDKQKWNDVLLDSSDAKLLL